MSAATPISPRVLRGALVALDPANPLASVTVFQYNPDTVSRTLQARTVDRGGAGRSAPVRLRGAPEETLSMDVDIDATDQLERAEPSAVVNGIVPQLSALEMLLYPKTATVIANASLAVTGAIEILPVEAPLTLLVWGPKRVLPVQVQSFRINEQAHDVNLNPIRASVSLGLRVLSYSDLPFAHPGTAIFLAHQVQKEVLATISSAGAITDVATELA